MADKRKQSVKLKISVAYVPTPDCQERLRKVMGLLLRHPAKTKEGEDANS